MINASDLPIADPREPARSDQVEAAGVP